MSPLLNKPRMSEEAILFLSVTVPIALVGALTLIFIAVAPIDWSIL